MLLSKAIYSIFSLYIFFVSMYNMEKIAYI